MARARKLMRSVIYPGLLLALLWIVIFEAPTTEHSSWPSVYFYLALFLVLYHCALYLESEISFDREKKYTIKSFLRDIFDVLVIGVSFSSLEYIFPDYESTVLLKVALCFCFAIPILLRDKRDEYLWVLDVLCVLALVTVIASFFTISLVVLSVVIWVLFGFYISFIVWRISKEKYSTARI